MLRSIIVLVQPGIILHSGPQIRVRNWKLFFLFFNQNICCGYSKEPSLWDGSFEHPKHMFKLMDKEIITILPWKTLLNWTYAHYPGSELYSFSAFCLSGIKPHYPGSALMWSWFRKFVLKQWYTVYTIWNNQDNIIIRQTGSNPAFNFSYG